MSKADPVEQALNDIGELRVASPSEDVAKQLRSYLKNRSNLVVAKAAKIVGELHLSGLIAELAAAFNRMMVNPAKLDKRCAAITEIVSALYELDYTEPEVYLQGIRHVQKEASFGPPIDTAATLRGRSAQGLLRTRYPDAIAIVIDLLVDPEPPARLGAIRALALNGGDVGPLLLRLITRGTLGPIVLDLTPDWRVFSFTAAVAILTGVLVGLVPAWQMSRQEPALVLRERGGCRGTGTSGKVLIVAQIALSLVLLFGAGLLLRAFANLRSLDPGFQKTGILEAGLHPQPALTNSGQDFDTNTYRRQLAERATALPGAISAAFSDLPVPADGQGWKETVAPSGIGASPDLSVLAILASVSPGFFKTLAIPLVSGRDFDWSDDHRHAPIAIVDTQTASRLFPSGGAIGKRVRFGVQPMFQDLEIVGVVRAARLIDLRAPNQCVIYVPCTQYGDMTNLFVRGDHAAALVRTLDRQIRSLGREYVTEARTIEQMSDRTLVAERATAILSSAFAAAALLLAGIGLFGLMSYTVTRRTREIGIRMALGSQPGGILRMILRETLLLTLAGIAIGAPCALAVARFIAPADTLTLVAASSALFAVGAIAGYLPARSALKSDPMAALRCD